MKNGFGIIIALCTVLSLICLSTVFSPIPVTALSQEDAADYLVIVADGLYEEILPLAEWKHKKGFITRVVRMSEVGATADDVDTYVQNAYDTWSPAPSYVLLVGDRQDIPTGFYSGGLDCYSDHSFACTDGADYLPDITLGRLPVNTEAQCTNVVNKILQYDRTPDPGSWYGNLLNVGYFTDFTDGHADDWFMETSVTVRDFLRDAAGYTTSTAWTTVSFAPPQETYFYRRSSYPHRPINPDVVPQDVVDLWTDAGGATADITAAINGGVGLVQARLYGTETAWYDPPYAVSDINSLSNGAMTPVVFSISHETGSFHRNGGNSFCEKFLKKSPGGCVAIVGSTTQSIPGWDELLTHGIYTCFWPSYDSSHSDATYPHSWRPAEALNYGKYYMLTYGGDNDTTEGVFYMYHYFGDPEMMLRTTRPAHLSVTHPPTLTSSVPGDVTVTVASGITPIEGARVAITCADAPDDYWTGTTNSGGEVTFPGLTASRVAVYDIVVTAHDCEPYESTIPSRNASDGMVSLGGEGYSCSSSVDITVSDADITGAGTQEVTISTSGGDSETVALGEEGEGTFTGTLPTSSSPVQAGDGTLQVSHAETVTATYIDADNGSGGTNVATTDEADIDCEEPFISGIAIVNVGEDVATITWTTSKPTTGRVSYGTGTDALDKTGEDGALSTDHSVTLRGLSSGTRYYCEAVSRDGVGHEATDSNGGAYYAFTTDTFAGYSTGFEGGALGPGWTTTSGVIGRIQVTSANGPHSGNCHVTMDTTQKPCFGTNQNYLTLLADLSPVSADAVLRYWYKEYSDENNYNDAVLISNDGENFEKIVSHFDGPSTWTEHVIDLDGSAAAVGLTLAEPLYIRWGQNDDEPIPNDGVSLDDIAAGGYIPVDTDGDGAPDNVDDDDDNDGLSDAEEVRDYGSDPVDSDTDGDNLSDGDEINIHGTGPTDPDSDNDGLYDGSEINIYGTLATDPDTDGDGHSDIIEIFCGGAATALDPDRQPDTVQLNFQPSGSVIPAQYAPANPKGYRQSRGYGWR